MEYYSEMRTKFGFDDGEHIPAGIEGLRKLYITAINYYAEKRGSAYRAIAYDRGGLHNWCMIMFVALDKVPADYSLDYPVYATQMDLYEALFESVEDADLALRDAIDDADQSDLDDYVKIVFEVDFDSWFDGLDNHDHN